MSAAIYSEPQLAEDADEVHPGLGPTTIKPQALAGRPMFDLPKRRPVELKLWALTPEGIRSARDAMSVHPDRNSWDIARTVEETGPVSTIRRLEPGVVAQGAFYGWAWAVYHI